MTREEAALILDPETSRDALLPYESQEERIAVCEEACRLGAAALREQEERENPKPLTLDELREMDGEPVWLMGDDKFYIVNNDFRLPWGKREPCGVDMWGAGTSLSLLAECGLYRHKPKEV